MSEVKRYCIDDFGSGMRELEEGPYVAFEDFDAQRLRADTAEAERDEQRRLRASSEGSNAAWRMTVGLAEAMLENPAYELSGVDWDYEHSIHDKVRAKNEKLAAAEQRMAELTKAFEKFRDLVRGCERLASKYSPCIDAVDEDGGDDNDDPTLAIFHRLYYAMFDADAALNPNPEAESHE